SPEYSAALAEDDAEARVHDADPGRAGRVGGSLPGLHHAGEEARPGRALLVHLLVPVRPVDAYRRPAEQHPRRPVERRQRAGDQGGAPGAAVEDPPPGVVRPALGDVLAGEMD